MSKMSEEELNTLLNKFEMWMVLHGYNAYEYATKAIPHFTKVCPLCSNFLGGHDCKLIDETRTWFNGEKAYEGYRGDGKGGGRCIEWVKYV
jgi:hypothetical protein